MAMIVGGTSVALVESKLGGMQCEAYPTRLALVLELIDNGALSPTAHSYYGSDGHKAALDAVERQVQATREKIAECERRDAEDRDGRTWDEVPQQGALP